MMVGKLGSTCLAAAIAVGMGPLADRAIAQPFHEIDSSGGCQGIIDKVVADIIIDGFNVVDVWRSEAYGNHPSDRPEMLGIAFDDWQPIEQLDLSNFTQRLLAGCDDLAGASYGVAQTGGSVTYGLVDGRIQEFQCIPAGTPGELPWGYQYCGI